MKIRRLELGLLGLVLIFLLSLSFNNHPTRDSKGIDINSDQNLNIKPSDYWEMTSPIYIDDSNPSMNWSLTNSSNFWCNGAGTWEDPYIIENITIDGGNNNTGITVANSSVYFLIRNCTIINTGSLAEDSGIKLINVNNSGIIGNTFSDFNQIGIYLKDSCMNNTIYNNSLFEEDPNKSLYGIYLNEKCSNNTIKNNNLQGINRLGGYDAGAIHLKNNCNDNQIINNLVNRSKHGISLNNSCDKNTLFNNSLISNSENGIYLYSHCDKNIIYNNTIDFNKNGIEFGILSDNNNYLEVHNNKLHNNSEYGISISNSRYSKIWKNELYNCGFRIESSNITYHRDLLLSINNTVNGKNVYYYVEEAGLDSTDFFNAGQIILIDCNHTHLANFDFSFCSRGIYISKVADGGNSGSSFNISISNVTLKGNLEGVYSRNSYNISFSNITAKNNSKGIFLFSCSNSSIKNCTLNKNSISGIDMNGCYNINITNNYIQFNLGDGISLSDCDYNKILNNTISNNAYNGILHTLGGINNFIFRNKIIYNNKSGIYLYYSFDSHLTILNNTLSYNLEHGIYFEWDNQDNIISENYIYNNGKSGIFLYDDCNRNNITLNQIHHNGENGIFLNRNIFDGCDENNISLNQVYENTNHGIYIYSSESNIISNNTLYGNDGTGIRIEDDCQNSILIGNIVENANYGIHILDSSDNNVSQNEMVLCGLLLSGTISEMGSHTIDDTNMINQKKLYYYVNQTNLSPNSFMNAGQIIFIQCNDTIVQNVNTSYGSVGVSLYECYNITLNELISSNNRRYGVYLKETENCTLLENSMEYNAFGGIFLYYLCQHNNISRNQINYNLKNGIQMRYSSTNNQILDNNVTQNGEIGIYLHDSSDYCNISNNNIFANSLRGVYIESTSYCQIYHNDFRTNGLNAEDNGTSNFWDNGSLGNYWDDYEGFDNDANGIGDIPYYIPGTANSMDNFPIWSIPSPIVDGGDDSSGYDEDDTPYEIAFGLIIIGCLIAAGLIASYYALHVYSNRHPANIGKKKFREEPLLDPLKKEKEVSESEIKDDSPSQLSEFNSEKEAQKELKSIVEEYEQYSPIKRESYQLPRRFEKIYKDTLNENPLIKTYLESDISVDDIPDGDKLVTTILDDEELRKIDKIKLSRDEKKIFLKEIISMNKKDRKNLLNELLNNLD
ncbi:MAG: hypothetical protein GF383_10110 [Candidatus Lokiarchaeota archaeon]|nr:hypothetical protein [Candidatus Lokiarchaeota archaeon]MBD3340894.1 hypothetical protein [Candidatus Lokiarchaeota archaeon]